MLICVDRRLRENCFGSVLQTQGDVEYLLCYFVKGLQTALPVISSHSDSISTAEWMLPEHFSGFTALGTLFMVESHRYEQNGTTGPF